jgi:hypothetical protein
MGKLTDRTLYSRASTVVRCLRNCHCTVRHPIETSAGSAAGKEWRVGGFIGVEIDVNARDDYDVRSALGASGLIITSGGGHHPLTGLTVSRAFSYRDSWRHAAILSGYTDYGLYILPPDAEFPTAVAINAYNGPRSTGSVISGGNPVLTLGGSSSNLLRLTPSVDDFQQAVIFGTNAANNQVKYKILQSGKAFFSSINVSGLVMAADNAAAIAAGLVQGDLYRTATGVLMVVF